MTAPASPGRSRTYRFPRLPLALWAVDMLLGRRRSFARDSRITLAANPPPPRFDALAYLAAEGPLILVMNHYERPGLPVHFCAMAVSLAVAERRPQRPEVRWVITSEQYGRHFGPLPIPVWLIRWLFRRLDHLYGLVVMPRAPERRVGRAAALRHIARDVRRGEAVGLVPEALGKGTLIEALPGSGLFLASLSDGRVPIVPVGLWEDDELLNVRFGEPFTLASCSGDRQAADDQARERVMVAIGRLLPRRHWGLYAEAIAREVGEAAPPGPAPVERSDGPLIE